jgi:hypothetical protein
LTSSRRRWRRAASGDICRGTARLGSRLSATVFFIAELLTGEPAHAASPATDPAAQLRTAVPAGPARGARRCAGQCARGQHADDRPRAPRAARISRAPGVVGPAPQYAKRGSPERKIHDAGNTTQLPGKLIRSEGQAASKDLAVDEAYDALGATWRLYHDIYERDSIDGAGMPLTGSVHYGNDYDNAFWNGTQMVFGDGDGEVFNRFTIAVDIIGHELTHGVIDHESGWSTRASRARSTNRSATCSARSSSSMCSSRPRSRPTGWWARGFSRKR